MKPTACKQATAPGPFATNFVCAGGGETDFFELWDSGPCLVDGFCLFWGEGEFDFLRRVFWAGFRRESEENRDVVCKIDMLIARVV